MGLSMVATCMEPLEAVQMYHLYWRREEGRMDSLPGNYNQELALTRVRLDTLGAQILTRPWQIVISKFFLMCL
jgi:hypothetical protein